MKIKKSALFRILFSFLFILFFLGLGKGLHTFTGGFRLQKILTDFSSDLPNFEFSKEEAEGLDQIFSQKFFYSAKGRQAYVFESEDGQYVIKFLRYHLLKPPFWLYLLRFPMKFDAYRNKEILSKKNQLESVMESYRLAFDDLKDETQVLFIHLAKTKNLNKKITLIDRIGRKYVIDLDSMGFLLQKKVDLLKDVLSDLKKKKDEEGVQRVYRAYLDVILSRLTKGIVNKDQCWYKNYGMLDGKACEIDMGRFAVFSEEQNLEIIQAKLYHDIFPLRSWIEKSFPSLLPDFDSYYNQCFPEK